MSRRWRIAIFSDVHYAGPTEKLRGNDFEYRNLHSPLKRRLVKFYRHYIWLRHPLEHNDCLDRFIAEIGTPDWVIGNGDYGCDANYFGVSDEATMESAREGIGKVRARFGDRFRATFGDHDIGKVSFAAERGGMRLESIRRAHDELGMELLWRVDLGDYVLLGVTSSLVALPLFEPQFSPDEFAKWRFLAQQHWNDIHKAFSGLSANQRVLLFCHDPSALAFMMRDDIVRAKLPQIEQTIVGHLHSHLVMRAAKMLAGIPKINFLGAGIGRLSTTLSNARCWRDFKVRLCPSLAGIEMMNDGGYYMVELDETANEPAHFQLHYLNRK